MAKVEIYTWRTCPFCIRAKHLLDSKQVSYTEYAIDGDNAARDAMAERSGGRRSVPEIFIDDRHIGQRASHVSPHEDHVLVAPIVPPDPDYGRLASGA